MGAKVIVLLSPILDDASGFLQGVEQIAIHTFLSEFADEALNVSIFPGTAGGDIDRLATLRCQPVLYLVGNKLWTIVTADVLGCAINKKEPIK